MIISGITENAKTEEDLLNLSSEFHMKMQWLPTGKNIKKVSHLSCPVDPLAGSIAQSIAPDAGIKSGAYINIARIISPMSERKLEMPGRRGVYLAVMRDSYNTPERIRFIRIQKMDVCFYLDAGFDIDEAVSLARRYSKFVLLRHKASKMMEMKSLQSMMRDILMN